MIIARCEAVNLGRFNGEVEEDRISELHIDLKHLILKHLPVTEISRAGVLSRQWRHVLLSHPNLIFDRNSYKGIYSSVDEFLNAIKRTLSDHTGTIDKFTLFIPQIYSVWSLKDSYILVREVTGLLPASITHLCIDNASNVYFPVSAINISLLQKLTNLEINRGSFELETISLDFVQNTSCILPRLTHLSLRSCKGPKKLTNIIPLSTVTDFVMDNCEMEACSFSKPCTLSSLTFSLRWDVQNPSIGFLHLLPKLKRLQILDFTTIEGLSICLNQKAYADEAPWALQKLILHTVSDPKSYQNLSAIRKPVIPHLIVLLKRAKNVEELCITGYIGHVMACKSGCFENYINKDLTLDRLQSISFIFSMRLNLAVVLLRFLLGCSPALINLNIGYCISLCSKDYQEAVEKTISELDRASPNVKVTYFDSFYAWPSNRALC